MSETRPGDSMSATPTPSLPAAIREATQQNDLGTTEKNQPQVQVPSRDATAWPSEFTEAERDLLRSGLAFLSMHHVEQRKQFAKDAANPTYRDALRRRCRAVVAHHVEELHQIGELAAKCGWRNAYPRTPAEMPFVAGTSSVVLAVDPAPRSGADSWSIPANALTLIGTPPEDTTRDA